MYFVTFYLWSFLSKFRKRIFNVYILKILFVSFIKMNEAKMKRRVTQTRTRDKRKNEKGKKKKKGRKTVTKQNKFRFSLIKFV